MKNLKLIFFFLFVLFLNMVIFAGNGYRLNDLIELMEKNNLLLKISKIDKDIVKEEYKISRALPNPELEFSKGKGQVFDKTEKHSLWGLGLKFRIQNPFYRYFFLKSKRKTLTESEIHFEIRKRQIVRDLKNHYFRFQLNKKIQSFLMEKFQILNEISKIIKAKVSIGEAKEIDNLRASVEIQKNRTELFRIEKILAYERTKINEFLNNILAEDFELIEDFSFTPLYGIEKRIKFMVKNSPVIRLKINKYAFQKENVKASRFSIIESIEFFGQRGREMDGKIWKAGIGIGIPIFNTKSLHIKKAKLEKTKALTELEHSQKHLFADIQRLVSEIRILEREIKTFKGAILKQGKRNVELSEQLYREGEIPLVVFLDSQNSFFEIKKRFYEAITEWKILKAKLDELLGGKQ